MASFWPRLGRPTSGQVLGSRAEGRNNGFEREGDRMYLAAEVLQGRYGKATDVFSFGMTMLETATNSVVPAQYVHYFDRTIVRNTDLVFRGELWHLLREDLSPVEGLKDCSEALVGLIRSMSVKILLQDQALTPYVLIRSSLEYERGWTRPWENFKPRVMSGQKFCSRFLHSRA